MNVDDEREAVAEVVVEGAEGERERERERKKEPFFSLSSLFLLSSVFPFSFPSHSSERPRGRQAELQKRDCYGRWFCCCARCSW